MAEITEVIEDFADNTKKVFKDKKFLLAAVGVGAVALFVGWNKTRNAATADATAYEAIGYAGYPAVGGGDISDSVGSMDATSEFDSTIYEAIIDENNSYYDGEIDALTSNITALSNRLLSAEEQAEEQRLTIERQNAISQMKANSELYNNITDSAQKQALHEENKAIAEQYGFTFAGGNWFDGESVLYTTARQQSGAVNTAKTAESGSVNFTNNRDYQSEINAAILNGADATTINNLNEERNAKIVSSGKTLTKANESFSNNADYSTLITKAKAMGVAQGVIDNLTAQRNAKIAANPELEKYK